MKKSLVFASIAVVSFTAASSAQFELKGHALGETLTQFQTIGTVPQVLATCKAEDDSRIVTVDRLASMSNDDFAILSLQLSESGYGDSLSRNKVKKLLEKNGPTKMEPIKAGDWLFCDNTDKVFNKHSDDTWLGATLFRRDDGSSAIVPNQTVYSFHEGVLSDIEAQLRSDSFDDSVSDMNKRTGSQPNTVQDVPMYNSTGAKWNDREAIWKTQGVYVELREYNNPNGRKVTLSAESAAYLQYQQAKDASRPSQLD